MDSVIIKGSVKAILFYSESNNFQIVKFSVLNKYLKDIDKYFSSKSIIVKGSFDRKLTDGEELEIEGNIVLDKKYGYQINVTSFKREVLNNKSSLLKYLTSPLFTGIGEVTANRVIEELGVDLINKIESDEHALDEVNIPVKLKEVIRNGILLDKTNNEAIMYFLNGGFTVDVASNIINKITLEKMDRIYDNPYIMQYLDINSLTFEKIDQFSLNKGIKYNDIKRLIAICFHLVLSEASDNGSTYILKSKLFNNFYNYLYKENIVISDLEFEKILDSLVSNKKIVIEDDKVFISFFHYAEFSTASRIIKRLENKDNKIIEFNIDDINTELSYIIDKLEFTLTSEQIDAIKNAFLNNVLVITGGPGTGKTTIISTIVKLYSKLTDQEIDISDIALLAPTGRAAKRMSDATNHVASTIHRYLGYDGNQYNNNHDNPKKERLVIVDEASMMDITLFYHLLDGINPNSRLVIVGDVDQLPAIGCGDILSDLINSNCIPTIRLNEIFRQEEGSTIIPLSKMVNSGYINDDIFNNKSDLMFIHEEINVVDEIMKVLNHYMSLDYDLLNDIQIIGPQYKGANGIDAINNLVQSKVNYLPIDSLDKLVYGSHEFRKNDKVIQLVNKPEKQIMNGDIGYVDSFIYDKNKIKGLIVQFDDIKVEYQMDELMELKLAYAITVHKAQGSEFKIIIMPILKENYYMLKRKLIYTGITRAKELLILIGNLNTFKSSIRNIEQKRNTMLDSYLSNDSVNGNSIYNKEEKNTNILDQPFKFNMSLDEFINKDKSKDDEEIIDENDESCDDMFDEFTF